MENFSQKRLRDYFRSLFSELLSNEFLQVYFQSPYSLDYTLKPEEIGVNGVSIKCGATRGCIIDTNFDYVFKFEFEDNQFQYCSREVEIYQRAKALHLDQYLTEVTYLGSFGQEVTTYAIEDFSFESENPTFEGFKQILEREAFNLPQYTYNICLNVYAYKKVDYFYSYVDDFPKEEIKRIKKFDSPLSYSPVVGAFFVKDYGQEEFEKFSTFLIEEEIDDLHMENVGKMDGKVVILDFAGYKEEYSACF